MMSFNEYTEYSNLSEALIRFAKQAYPKFGNVLILAGGAGSGKGFVLEKLVGMEGFNFDVDQLKLLSVRVPGIIKKVKDELGLDISSLDPSKHKGVLKNPDNVGLLHDIIGTHLSLDDKRLNALYTSILTAHPDRKPNLIFDVTLKDLRKLQNLSRSVKQLGYDNDKIHVVWVVNDIEVAVAQNAKRDRTVPAEILVNTHRGSSQTIHDIVNMGTTLNKYMDGDIVFAFNKVGVDSEFVKGTSTKKAGYIKTANYFYVKQAGKPVDKSKLTKDIRAKIASYVPPSINWAE